MSRIQYMAGPEERLSQRLSHLPPTFTARGVYRRADAEPTAHLDLLAVCTRAPMRWYAENPPSACTN